MKLRPILVGLILLFGAAGAVFGAAGGETRIVSLMPSQTEMIFSLGFGSKVVGVSDYCNYPPEVASLPRVGGLELNLEKIVSLRPTLLVDLSGFHKKYETTFRELGLDYMDLPMTSFSDIPSAALILANHLGDPHAGSEFVRSWNETLERIRGSRRKSGRVYFEIWDSPPQAAGPESFIGEMIELAGGRNVVPRTGVQFPFMNPELVVREDPEIIFLAYPVDGAPRVAARPGWEDLAAVKSGRVMVLQPDLFVRPGPRCLEAIKLLAEIIGR